MRLAHSLLTLCFVSNHAQGADGAKTAGFPALHSATVHASPITYDVDGGMPELLRNYLSNRGQSCTDSQERRELQFLTAGPHPVPRCCRRRAAGHWHCKLRWHVHLLRPGRRGAPGEAPRSPPGRREGAATGPASPLDHRIGIVRGPLPRLTQRGARGRAVFSGLVRRAQSRPRRPQPP